MTVLEDYSVEALACICNILADRVKRSGECLISNKAITRILIERFGLSYGSIRYLAKYVIDFLVREGKLLLWDSKPRADVYKVILK